MVKNETKRSYGIKGKLTAAIAMLLVAVIMVVSSTYAWFTLSTAPEVKGITTAIGANGALEMLLATKENGQWVYKTGVLDTSDPNFDENLYWGNLVDLSDERYGSAGIVLYPSKLNETGDGYLAGTPLATPIYNDRGRVTGTDNNVVSGNFQNGAFYQNDEYFGFRALGVASGMTERQMAFRNTQSEMVVKMRAAKNAAAASLINNGSALANIAVKKGTGTDNFTQEEYNAINRMISELYVALDAVEDAYFQAVLLLGASATTPSDEAYEAIKTTVNGTTRVAQSYEDLDEMMLSLNTLLAQAGASLPTALTNAMNHYKGAVDDVAAAVEALALVDTSDDSYTWTELSPALTKLVDVENLSINGGEAGVIDKNAIVNAVAAGKGIVVTMGTGSGVYADIADQCGDYSAGITVDGANAGTAYAGMSLAATMNTKTSVNPVYLEAVKTALAAAGSPSTGDASMPITEFYGYVVDLAFRTNAANSNLLLQADPIDRIYADNNNDATMGGGASMTFVSNEAGFGNDKVKALMAHIKIVFYDTDTNEIYAKAELDIENAVATADGITAKMYVVETATKYTYTDDASQEVTVYSVDATTFYTDAACTQVASLPTGVTPVATAETNKIYTNKITALTQNQVKHVSALVYLDGETIENKDVAATVAKTMSGTANFQFSSDGQLVPAEYADLHQTNVKNETATISAGATKTLASQGVSTWSFDGEATGWTLNGTVLTAPAGAQPGDSVVLNGTNAQGKVVSKMTVTVA